MADDPGPARPDLSGAAPLTDHADMDFFELLRQLETAGQRFGRAGGAEREPARLGQRARLGFAASDVAAFDPEGPGGQPFVGVNVLGLIGPEGPMPLHMTRWIMQRLSNRWFAGDASGATSDTSFIDFVNLLQHRMMALYWRAWADARPEVQIARPDGGRIMALMKALAGTGLPGSGSGALGVDGAKLHHATSLAQEVQGPDRLTSFVETVLGVPVRLTEFVGTWIDIPDRLQTRLGMVHCGLGTGAMAGGRVFDRQSRAELRIGPLSLDDFTAFLDDTPRWDRLHYAVVFASGKGIEYGVRLVLAAGEVPPARLGTARLGRTAWLAPADGVEADDLCFGNLVAAGERRAA